MILSRRTTLTIVIPDGALALETFAVRELAGHLARLEITTVFSKVPLTGHQCLLVGTGGWLKEDGAFSDQALHIRAQDEGTLLLTGPSPRGVLNAVYVFLEKFLGFIWFNAEETFVPANRAWDFTGLDFLYDPPFPLRSIACASTPNPAWSARRRLNFFADVPRHDWLENPGLEDSHCFAGKHCHNVFKLLSLGYFGTREDPYQPYENETLIRQLYREHPEYFALIKGRRQAYLSDGSRPEESDQTGNISLTHPEVATLLVKGARVLLDTFPKATRIGLSLRDNYDYCEETMQAPGGLMTALVDLANFFGRELEKTHPRVAVDFLAYHCTQRPPRQGRLHRNVSVRYCPIRVSQYHAFDESEHNLRGGLNAETPPSMSQPMKQIAQWRSIAESVVVWYYTLNLPYLHPQPSLRGHAHTFRLLRDAGVQGVYIEDNEPMAVNCFNDLRVYLLTSLLWDPQQEEEVLKTRFCEAYYGPAAGAVREYLELLHNPDSWDWERWLGPDGESKWDSTDREISWEWFGDQPGAVFPVPHFYTGYTARPPLKPEFFRRAAPVAAAVRDHLERTPLAPHLTEFLLSFYYGVLSYPCGLTALEAEAKAWFVPRYQKLLDECALKASAFHGLDRLGLRWPVPTPCTELREAGV